MVCGCDGIGFAPCMFARRDLVYLAFGKVRCSSEPVASVKILRAASDIQATSMAASWRRRLVPAVVAMAALALAHQLASRASDRGNPESEPSGGPVKSSSAIPVGVVLPVRLENTISIKEAHAGGALEGRISQDVPLPDRRKLRASSAIKGSILSVVKDSDGAGVQVTLQFNQIDDRKQIPAAATSLRAMASYQAVRAAQMPFSGADTGTPSGWASTVQIGGDIRFGDGAPVRNRAKERIGKGVLGGVLVYIRANPEKGCEGPAKGDDHLQALWVFSSDACGLYDLKDTQISHWGETAPVGEITLHFEQENARIEAGTAVLLRVVSQPWREFLSHEEMVGHRVASCSLRELGD
jgi:hypothetical protein